MVYILLPSLIPFNTEDKDGYNSVYLYLKGMTSSNEIHGFVFMLLTNYQNCHFIQCILFPLDTQRSDKTFVQ